MKVRGTVLQDGLQSENEEVVYDNWLLQWGFADGRGLVKSDYLIPFF